MAIAVRNALKQGDDVTVDTRGNFALVNACSRRLARKTCVATNVKTRHA